MEKRQVDILVSIFIRIPLLNSCRSQTVCLDDSPALGEIHTFRMAVWAAHLGGHQAEYENPATEESLVR